LPVGLLSRVIAGPDAEDATFGDLHERGASRHDDNVRAHVFRTSPIWQIWQRAWRALTRSARERYRPEKHYMRGPGPKYRAHRIDCDAGKPEATIKQHANDN